MFFFKLTIPLNETSWSKTVAIIQAIFAPQWFLFAIQLSLWQPFDGSPGLYAYALPLSAEVSSYVGFLMSISWIYFISSEIVNVVTMLGVISQISHEVRQMEKKLKVLTTVRENCGIVLWNTV
ncbi:unnamed protein product [Nippostrongylus brasiliensis]|uniref:Sodium/potassium/calcium exchanger 6, mitochondrial (inferred by orthology to a human protein) n=1 Tax=Nippostrongylus brasiliensis TaxID=27835 RepID=A0A0N4YDU6_NIPBR|nr:unnamed protein product [Nippostrongylus brasiliensis]